MNLFCAVGEVTVGISGRFCMANNDWCKFYLNLVGTVSSGLVCIQI